MNQENIAVVGLGKLGLTWALVLASKGYKVHGVDISHPIIISLKKGKLPISEPGCDELFEKYSNNLRFYADINEIDHSVSTIFYIVPTPSLGDNKFDSSYVEKALINSDSFLCNQKTEFTNVVITSTVMPGECRRILHSMSNSFQESVTQGKLGFCYNPEFIALGSVVKDMLNPDFILIGSSDEKSALALTEIYQSVNGSDVIVKRMSLESAEIAKISINTFLTLKISYANQIGLICDRINEADKFAVCEAIGSDTRVGHKYLKPGLGFGGPCLPRDTRAFTELCHGVGLPSPLSEASALVNKIVETNARSQVSQCLNFTAISQAKVLICGITYKRDSWLLEDSHPFSIAQAIRNIDQTEVYLYDPNTPEIVKYSTIWKDHQTLFKGLHHDINEALNECPDVIVICSTLSNDELSKIKHFQTTQTSHHAKSIALIDLVSNFSETGIKFQPRTCKTEKSFKEIYKAPPSLSRQITSWFEHVIGTSAPNSHELLLQQDDNKLLNKNSDQSTDLHAKIYNAFDSDNNFLVLYQQLISYTVNCYKINSDRLLVQSFPSVRFQFPNNISVFEFHKDSFYSHPHEEINTFYAVTDCLESSSLWTQEMYSGSLNSFSTYKPLNLPSGSLARLDTATTWHGDTPNLTTQTRISFDFRILLSDSHLNHMSTISGKKKISVGSYYRYFNTYSGGFI